MSPPYVSGALVAVMCASCMRCDRSPSASGPDAAPHPTSSAALATADAAPVNRAPLPPGFVKGQLHTHTAESEDSATPPAQVQRWYEERGYDFVVFTDHNAITDTPDTSLLTIRGAELTRTMRTCAPPAPPNRWCALHVNALFVTAPLGRVDPGTTAEVIDRKTVYEREIAKAKELGGLAMLNHPNMQSGADSDLVLALARKGPLLLEVGNQSWDSENEGDRLRPSTQAIWDRALAGGVKMFATVTDDAHHYADAEAVRAHGDLPFTGDLGFVVVRAEKSAEAIRDAIARGDFYGSTGIVFETIETTADTITLVTRGGREVRFEAIARGGEVVETKRAARFEARLGPDQGPYLRVRATADDGAIALVQPIFRR